MFLHVSLDSDKSWSKVCICWSNRFSSLHKHISKSADWSRIHNLNNNFSNIADTTFGTNKEEYKLHLPTYVSVVTGETEVACYTPPHTQTPNSSKPNALINFQWLWGTFVFAFELMCTIYERLLLHCIVLHWHNGMTLHNYEVPKYGFLEISH